MNGVSCRVRVLVPGRLLAFIIAAAALPSTAMAGHTFTPAQQAVVDAWLVTHPEYRLATIQDCGCEQDVKDKRTGSDGVPDYDPYRATGDFNGDGRADIAVVVVKRTNPVNGFALLVFNGPLDPRRGMPAFIKEGIDLRRIGLFYGGSLPEPYRLIVGPFASDNVSILVPKGNSYIPQ